MTENDYAALEARWIDRQLAMQAQLRRVDSLTGAEMVGRKGGNYAGILIPYFHPHSGLVRDYRLRRDQPDVEYDSAGNLRTRQKYLAPPGRSNMLYLVPGTEPSLLSDPALPVVLTEGEFKTLALGRAGSYRATSPRFLPVGVSGVYNWRGTIGKTVGPDGCRMDVKGAIPDLDWIVWNGRRVIISYDADAVLREPVRIARSALAAHLRTRGALVGFLEWDISKGKGIDDHLASMGPDVVLHAIEHVDFGGSAWKKGLLRSKPPMSTTEGRILPILANAIAAFRHAPEWGGVLAFDEFAFGTVVLKPAPWGVVGKGEWSDHEDRLAAEWLQRQGILVSVDVAGQAVQTAARDHPFHPVRSYLHDLRWDGQKRVDRWLSTYLGAENTEYSRAVGSRWLISAVARIFRPGAKADCCLILEGPQGSRKSTALRTLAGEFFTDELADLGSKDAAMQTRGVWIIELSELDSLSHAEVARIKAFMSRTTDRFRPPYGMRLMESTRQCVFAGTVNHATYLRDETGGRRFWPITCGPIDVEALARDRDQLWAEARGRFESGAAWWLDTHRLPDLYGSRFFDILLLDALYAQTPVLELIRKIGWDAVISLKQNSRDLYQSAVRLFASRPPDLGFTEQRDYKTYQVQLWDTEGLPFTIDNPEPVRVVRSEEVLDRNRYREGELTSHSTDHEWLWVTTLPKQVFPTPVIRQLGHSRWKNENNGWMDLTKHWAFKHAFLHACRHRPQQTTASGEREPVSNHGLAAVTLILLIAFALSSAFVLRHSKLARQDHLTTIAVAAQLRAWVSKTPPPIRAPD